jgi:hypothetical protein
MKSRWSTKQVKILKMDIAIANKIKMAFWNTTIYLASDMFFSREAKRQFLSNFN